MGLEGTWYNELGSTLDITGVSGHTVSGTYETATGGGALGKFDVSGKTDTDSGGQTFGFSVTWTNAQSQCESTTSWAGEYQNVEGNEQLTALWLLVMQKPAQDEWRSTLVGEDVFTRQAASPEQIAQTQKRHSHP